MNTGAQELEQPFDDVRTAAAVTLRKRRRAQQQHRAHDLARVRLADADGMTYQQVVLKLLGVRGRDPPRREVAESGGDAVNDLAISNDAIDVIVSLHHSRPGVVREGDASFTARYGLDVGDGE
jgi:hypothetical protein